MKDCIFCKIVKREIPSEKIYEDENYLAFLDIHPQNKGHTIVIPKIHFENIFCGKEKNILGLGEVLKRVSILLKEKYGCEGVNLINNSGKVSGQEVGHFHFHVVPRYSEDKLNLIFDKIK
ncbi:HIT family protein [Candidatus Pacearchaeota archaeon CG10_big_fil_rev_8_21_14_0_10_32_42]|nr:MAG: HIT family protein [Candidatus Pacearchaeota archaeon CG10_big_fil_rev_8_21_14_0_10_32_42]